eukprot:1143977-Pelagomonas_calceolata.AAC.3
MAHTRLPCPPVTLKKKGIARGATEGHCGPYMTVTPFPTLLSSRPHGLAGAEHEPSNPQILRASH